MGAILSKPVLEKNSTILRDERVVCGSSSMQGWRLSMEDVHTTILRLSCGPADKHLSFFAVYDGHGGNVSAIYSGASLHLKIAAEEEFSKGNYFEAMKKGFLSADKDLYECMGEKNDQSGCTAIVALITDDWRVIVGNAGDSRAILSAAGTAVPLSFDHKPINAEEAERIVAGGGYIEHNRVNGNLALSRAIGDFRFKENPNFSPEEQIVTANPDVIERVLSKDDEFLVIACDGIWDCMTNQEVINFVRHEISQGTPIDTICEKIMDACVAENVESCDRGHDNMTVIIIGLLNNKKEEEWRNEIRRRPLNKMEVASNEANSWESGDQKYSENNDSFNSSPEKDESAPIPGIQTSCPAEDPGDYQAKIPIDQENENAIIPNPVSFSSSPSAPTDICGNYVESTT